MKKILYSMMALLMSALTFTSCEDVPMPYDAPGTGGDDTPPTETIEATGSGTAADPYNITALQEYAAGLNLESGSTSTETVYFRGKVVSVKECSASYGNATFYLSDDGTTTNQFYVYRCLGPGNKAVTSDDLIQEGDELVVCGTITNYNGTLETPQKGAYIVSINGSGTAVDPGSGTTAEASGKGTTADPYNVAAAMNIAAGLEKSSTSASYLSDEVYVKGKIVSITDTELSSYGNITYYISDDGTTTNQLEVYRGLSFGGAKFTALSDIKVGDEVVICGKLQNWLGTYEFTQGSSLYSINGSTSTSGGGNTGGGDAGGGEVSGTSEGVSINGTTVTLTNSAYTAGDETVTCTINDLGCTDKASAVGTYTLSDGSTLTVAQGDGKSGPTYYSASNGFRIYASNTLTFACKSNIAKIVFTCDSYNGTDYVGNATATVTFDGTKAVYCNKNDANSGGTQLRVQKIVITYAK